MEAGANACPERLTPPTAHDLTQRLLEPLTFLLSDTETDVPVAVCDLGIPEANFLRFQRARSRLACAHRPLETASVGRCVPIQETADAKGNPRAPHLFLIKGSLTVNLSPEALNRESYRSDCGIFTAGIDKYFVYCGFRSGYILDMAVMRKMCQLPCFVNSLIRRRGALHEEMCPGIENVQNCASYAKARILN